MNKHIEYLFKMLGTNNFVLTDIGAMGGIPKIWNAYENILTVVAFEPDEREYSKLISRKNIINLNYALADKVKQLDYYVTAAHGKSSNLQPNLELLAKYPCCAEYEIEKTLRLRADHVTSLDRLYENHSIPQIDFIKIDTQGSELSILKGGKKNIIDNLLGIQIEVEFVPLYMKQPLFRQVDEFLTASNFRLIDLKRYYWKRTGSEKTKGKGEIIFGDALYFMSLERFEQYAGTLTREEARDRLIKFIVLSLLYGMNDYTVALTRMGLNQHIIPPDEVAYFEALLVALNSEITILPALRGVSQTIRALTNVQKYLRRFSKTYWAASDLEIGNIIDF